jgi:23S rRNA (guanosine2251-2'-O)-methyltransferase
MKPGRKTGGTGARKKAAGARQAAPRAGGAPRGDSGSGGSGSGSGGARAAGGSPRSASGSRQRSTGGARQFSSHGAGRTGKVSPTGAPAKKPEKTLGGEQIEGRQAVRELLIAGARRVREIWVSAELAEAEVINETLGDILDIARHERIPVQHVARKRLETAARCEAPQGIIAYADPIPEADFGTLLRRRAGHLPFLVAVDGVTDPGNLGALLRCCDGAGVDGVVLPRHRAVHVTPTVAKSAAGAIEHVPMAVVGGLPTALQQMRDAGIWVVGLADDGERELFDIGDLAVEGICIVMGAEGAGLSRLVRERCDMIVSIPMLGRLSSLNVSAAAALATYEVVRARRS